MLQLSRAAMLYRLPSKTLNPNPSQPTHAPAKQGCNAIPTAFKTLNPNPSQPTHAPAQQGCNALPTAFKTLNPNPCSS